MKSVCVTLVLFFAFLGLANANTGQASWTPQFSDEQEIDLHQPTSDCILPFFDTQDIVGFDSFVPGTDECGCGKTEIKITKIKSGKKGANVALHIYLNITASPNTEYQWRLEAYNIDTKVTYLLDVQPVTTDGDGKVSPTFKSDAANVFAGVKYKFTAKLFKKGDSTVTGTVLAMDSVEHTVSSEEWVCEDDGDPSPCSSPINLHGGQHGTIDNIGCSRLIDQRAAFPTLISCSRFVTFILTFLGDVGCYQ